MKSQSDSQKGSKLRNFMRRFIFIFYLIISSIRLSISQDAKEFANTAFLKKLNKQKSYTDLKTKIVHEFAQAKAGSWGEFVRGMDEKLNTKEKIIAFTFDACGGKNGNGYDKELIDYLRDERIHATLFITGKWIDSQFTTFLDLSRDSLFEIENHGFNHQPCSFSGESAYGIKGTSSVEDAFDEIEANARKIEAITGRRPQFYRSATAFMDEACVSMAARLGITSVSYQVLSGDAVPLSPEKLIEDEVIRKVKPGAIIIMHMNHPGRNTKKALEKIVPELRKMGYNFVCLKDFALTSVKSQ